LSLSIFEEQDLGNKTEEEENSVEEEEGGI
jgi:hypothetical protein